MNFILFLLLLCILPFIGERVCSIIVTQNETIESNASYTPKIIGKLKSSEIKTDNGAASSSYSEAWGSEGNLRSKSLSEPEVKVAAVDNSGNIGKLSDIKSSKNNAHLNLSSDENFPPAQVTGLSVFIVNSTHLDLNWIVNTDSDLDHYNIYQHTSPNFPVIPGFTPPIGTSTTNSFSITGLNPSTKYYYKVAAVDNSGNIGKLSDIKSSKNNAHLNLSSDENFPPAQVTGLSVFIVNGLI